MIGQVRRFNRTVTQRIGALSDAYLRRILVHRLIWLDAADRVMASTTAVPRYGYTQFQP